MLIEPLVTVIIPTYNRAAKVGDAINSVLNQTYKNIQIIVVDDGSTDNTYEVVSAFHQVDYILQDHAGQAAARNNGLKNAKGSIIANLDSDDLWEPDFLESCATRLVVGDFDFVFANWAQDNKNGKSSDFIASDPFLKPFFGREELGWIDLNHAELRKLYLRTCPSPSSSVVMRKSSISGGWDEEINIGDDWTLYIDMIVSKKCKASFTLQKLWRKRVDEINIYDGRIRSEVLSLLYVKDIKRIQERHQLNLTKKEIEVLEKMQMRGLVELSKHKLLRELNLSHSYELFKKSCLISKRYTLYTIPMILFNGIENKLKSHFQKKVPVLSYESQTKSSWNKKK